MSGDFPVDERGEVTFPRLGLRSVVNQGSSALRASLVNDYQVYLRNPAIEITVLRRINILGAVAKPGLYPVDATMTVADALAMAGGVTPNGTPDKVDLIRNGQRVEANLGAGTKLADSPLRSGDQLFVQERNWFIRNSVLVSVGATALISLFSILRR